jgi:hypothetical protein
MLLEKPKQPLMSVNEKIETLFAESDTETNERGNELKRGFTLHSERYEIDFADGFAAEGWLQFDTSQDAWYFGVWVNPTTFQTLNYAEGDWTLCTCPDADHYNEEIQSAIDFYDEGYEAKAIDDNGGVTIYRQDRQKFLI